MKRLNKKGLQMSFQWIFAIIVGAIILILAIYGVTKFMNVEQGKQDVQKAKQLESLLNPLETSFETGKSIPITTNVKTRIYNDCNSFGEFGEQKIGIKQKNFGKTSTMQNTVTSKNRYIFSDEYVESEKIFHLITKPFNFPFKVGDLNYLISAEKTYCFQKPPESIGKELSSLNQSNLLINCEEEVRESEDTVKICFSGGDCDVNVGYNAGTIEKSKERVYFYNDALMYAGIFSTPENYECQLKRLMKRTEKLAKVYVEKTNTITSNCGNSMKSGLLALKNFAKEYNQSANLSQASQIVNRLEEQNEAGWECRLW